MDEQEFRKRAHACQLLARSARLESIRARWMAASALWTDRADRAATARTTAG